MRYSIQMAKEWIICFQKPYNVRAESAAKSKMIGEGNMEETIDFEYSAMILHI